MISDSDMKLITPREPAATPSSAHVQTGVPIPKPMRVRSFSPDDWEEFVEEWTTTLEGSYAKVRRFGGAGDCGIDVAGFCTPDDFGGIWDNYQCKRYGHPLRPSDIWVEIGKIIYYSYVGEFSVPRAHYFVASSGVGTALEKLLNKPEELKANFQSNWNNHCKKTLTATKIIERVGDFLAYVELFDFSIFSSRSHIELIDAHSHTAYHSVRFGGGLRARPKPDTPPVQPAANESRYIRQLLDAYGDHLYIAVQNPVVLKAYQSLQNDFLRQRERFYHAESLRNFARDTVPEGTFDELQDEVFHGVIDVTDRRPCERFRENASNRCPSCTGIDHRQSACLGDEVPRPTRNMSPAGKR